MATPPTPETSARRIIAVMVNTFHSRAGDSLRLNSFLQPFSQEGWRMVDLDEGRRYGAACGWLECDATSIRLTDQGFGAA